MSAIPTVPRMNLEQYKGLFQFDPSQAWLVGIEREFFLTNDNGQIIPIAPRVMTDIKKLPQLTDNNNNHATIAREYIPSGKYSHELSACQIEHHIGPTQIDNLLFCLIEEQSNFTALQRQLNFSCSTATVAPATMPLDIYPDPSGRYQAIAANMTPAVLLAACRIIGTHIHVGMPDHDTALKVYDHVTPACSFLCNIGNHCDSERLQHYHTVAPNWKPKPYQNWANFYRVATAQGFATNPRDCWTLIRLSSHGSIEFRMFNATSSLTSIARLARLCHSLCQAVLL